MHAVRIIGIPDCRMISSGIGMFGDGVLEKFMTWMEKQPQSIFYRNFATTNTYPALRQDLIL